MSDPDKIIALAWDDRGKVTTKKEYVRMGRAIAFAEKESAKPKVRSVELFAGDTKTESRFVTYAKGSPKGKAAKHAKSTKSTTATQLPLDSDNAARYEDMVKMWRTGKHASLQHFDRYGVTAAQAKEIRDRVKATTKPPAAKRPKRAAAAAKPTSTLVVPLADVAAVERNNDLIMEGMRALVREREARVKDAETKFTAAKIALIEARDAHTTLASIAQ